MQHSAQPDCTASLLRAAGGDVRISAPPDLARPGDDALRAQTARLLRAGDVRS